MLLTILSGDSIARIPLEERFLSAPGWSLSACWGCPNWICFVAITTPADFDVQGLPSTKSGTRQLQLRDIACRSVEH